VDTGGEGADREGLRKSRNALEQDVAITQETDDEATDKALLTDDHSAHFLREGLDPGTGFLHATIEFLDGWIHKTVLL
jgi:hypothetical protein